MIDKEVSPAINKQLQDLSASVLADCYMGKKWEIETIDSILKSILIESKIKGATAPFIGLQLEMFF